MASQDQNRISVDSLLLDFLDNHPANDMAANRNGLAASASQAQNDDDDVQVVGSQAVSSVNAPGSRALGRSNIQPPLSEAFAPAIPLLETDPNRPVQAPTTQTKKKPRTTRTLKPPPQLDVSSISLRGEATNSVPIYDTCDTIRREIRNALRRPGITQAAFLRAISTPGRRVLPRGLKDFLAKKGPLVGNKNYAYYAAYVFFEKARIRDGVAKSPDREVMERKWPHGVDTETDYSKGWFTIHERDRGVVVDKYGCTKVY